MSSIILSSFQKAVYNVVETEQIIIRNIIEKFVEGKSRDHFTLEEVLADLESSEIRDILIQKVSAKDEI